MKDYGKGSLAMHRLQGCGTAAVWRLLRMTGLLCLLLCGIVAAGCTAEKPTNAPGERVTYKTIDEAVQGGVAAEEGKLLSVEKDEGETFVFYTAQDGRLGVGSITSAEGGYRWYRGEGYHDSTGADIPYTVMSFTVKAESGHTVKVYGGKVYDEQIQQLNLLQDGVVKQTTKVADPSTGLYYFLVKRQDVPAESGMLEVKAVPQP